MNDHLCYTCKYCGRHFPAWYYAGSHRKNGFDVLLRHVYAEHSEEVLAAEEKLSMADYFSLAEEERES